MYVLTKKKPLHRWETQTELFTRFVALPTLPLHKYFVTEMTSLVRTCLPTKHNMADKDGGCVDEGCESKAQICGHKLKGPEKDLQAIFKKLKVDNGP